MKNNNLVSKNPVLRFKLGKRIIKAELGVNTQFIGIIPGVNDIDTQMKINSLPSKRNLQKTSSFIFYGTKAGGSVNRNALSNITKDLKSKLIGTGKFTEKDFDNTKSLLIALNNYFANDAGAGSIKPDNMWGDQTLKAFDLALKRAASPAVATTKGIEILKPVSIFPTYTPPTTPTNLEVANLNLNVPQQTYDRTGVREFIRSKGVNPYSFSGALRRALRMVLNNTADDNDRLLVKGMGLFKKGGLISKSPIERFKLKLTKINF